MCALDWGLALNWGLALVFSCSIRNSRRLISAIGHSQLVHTHFGLLPTDQFACRCWGTLFYDLFAACKCYAQEVFLFNAFLVSVQNVLFVSTVCLS